MARLTKASPLMRITRDVTPILRSVREVVVDLEYAGQNVMQVLDGAYAIVTTPRKPWVSRLRIHLPDSGPLVNCNAFWIE